MNDYKPLREAVWTVRELAIKMRGLLNAHPEDVSVSVPHDDLERFVTLTSFIAGFRFGELVAKGKSKE